MGTDQILLRGIRARGVHGVYDFERRDGQEFVADVTIGLDFSGAGDELSGTLDYSVVAEEVSAVLSGEPSALIETVAERIAAAVLAHPQARTVEVTVHKPQAPIPVPFDDAAVRIRRSSTGKAA
jgi:dihydroneopterin aldolase